MDNKEIIQQLQGIEEELKNVLSTISYCSSAEEQVIFLEEAVRGAQLRIKALRINATAK